MSFLSHFPTSTAVVEEKLMTTDRDFPYNLAIQIKFVAKNDNFNRFWVSILLVATRIIRAKFKLHVHYFFWHFCYVIGGFESYQTQNSVELEGKSRSEHWNQCIAPACPGWEAQKTKRPVTPWHVTDTNWDWNVCLQSTQIPMLIYKLKQNFYIYTHIISIYLMLNPNKKQGYLHTYQQVQGFTNRLMNPGMFFLFSGV